MIAALETALEEAAAVDLEITLVGIMEGAPAEAAAIHQAETLEGTQEGTQEVILVETEDRMGAQATITGAAILEEILRASPTKILAEDLMILDPWLQFSYHFFLYFLQIPIKAWDD